MLSEHGPLTFLVSIPGRYVASAILREPISESLSNSLPGWSPLFAIEYTVWVEAPERGVPVHKSPEFDEFPKNKRNLDSVCENEGKIILAMLSAASEAEAAFHASKARKDHITDVACKSFEELNARLALPLSRVGHMFFVVVAGSHRYLLNREGSDLDAVAVVGLPGDRFLGLDPPKTDSLGLSTDDTAANDVCGINIIQLKKKKKKSNFLIISFC